MAGISKKASEKVQEYRQQNPSAQPWPCLDGCEFLAKDGFWSSLREPSHPGNGALSSAGVNTFLFPD
jgi:hypothetical protein